RERVSNVRHLLRATSGPEGAIRMLPTLRARSVLAALVTLAASGALASSGASCGSGHPEVVPTSDAASDAGHKAVSDAHVVGPGDGSKPDAHVGPGGDAGDPCAADTGGTSGSSSITAVWANEGGDKVTQDELRGTT